MHSSQRRWLFMSSLAQTRRRFQLEESNSWCLTLDLVGGNNHCFGSMTVYRAYANRDLQLDINLLTSKFPTALTEALDRHLPLSIDSLAESKEGSEFGAAQYS